jgi:hypothetical protein
MKKAIFILLFTFLIKFSFGQTPSLVGAWYWSDSTKETSMFFKQDGTVSMHSGIKGGVILTKNLRKGKFVLKNYLLVITWVDNNVENDKLKFLDKNSFQITLTDKQNKKLKRDLVFTKVIDEDVIEVKSQ